MRLENLNIGEIHLPRQPLSAAQRLAATLAQWRERARQRHELAHLDPIAQRDLGLTEADIWREVRKSPWQS